MTYQPLEDRLLVRLVKKTEPEKTDSGIIIDHVKKETQEGVVVAIGAGRHASETGQFIPTVLGEGDSIIIPFGYGMDFDTPEEKGLKLIREGDVLLCIKKAE